MEEKEGDSGGNILLVVAGGVGPDGQLKRTVEVIELNLKHAGKQKHVCKILDKAQNGVLMSYFRKSEKPPLAQVRLHIAEAPLLRTSTF